MRFGPYFARTKAGDAAHSHVGADMPPSAAAQNSLNTTLWQRALAACMSVVLAVSMAPSAALAGDDATRADSAEPALSASDEESQDASADEASVAEEPVAQEVPTLLPSWMKRIERSRTRRTPPPRLEIPFVWLPIRRMIGATMRK